jgi:MFS family permease
MNTQQNQKLFLGFDFRKVLDLLHCLKVDFKERDRCMRLASPKIGKGTLLGLGSFEFMTFMRRGVFYTFMIYYLYDLLGQVTIVALFGTLTMVASSLGQNFLWGKIADRYKLRTQLIVIGEIAAGIAYILVFLLQKSLIDAGEGALAGIAIIFGLSILEFFWSMSDVGWAALVADITTVEIRGAFIGTINFISSLGRMTGVLFSGFLYMGGLGFRQGTIFYIVTAMLFAGATIMYMASRALKSKTTRLDKSEKKEETKLPDKTQTPTDSHSRDTRAFTWFLIALIVIVLGQTATNQVFLLFLKLPGGLNATDEQVSLIVSAFTFGGMTASILVGRLSDKIGRHKVILTGLVLAAATLLAFGIVPNIGLMALAYGINGVSFMTLQTASFALAGDIIPAAKRGRLLSRYNAVMALSWGPAGLLIGGPLADAQTGILGFPKQVAYTNAFLTAALLVVAGAFVFMLKVRDFRQESR